MDGFLSLGAAMAGGVLPALAWLWFWLREDSKHPEPRRLIALAFLAGMVGVGIVIPIEQFVAAQIGMGTATFTIWSIIEECTKFALAYATVLRLRENDEPIDAVIYMVVVALGFAAAENTLFLLSPLAGVSALQEIMTGNLRFIGATLLHVLSSSAIGVFLGLAFYYTRTIKMEFALIGLTIASTLHAAFNYYILNTPEQDIFRVFGFVWLGIIVLLAVVEYIKRIQPRLVG